MTFSLVHCSNSTRISASQLPEGTQGQHQGLLQPSDPLWQKKQAVFHRCPWQFILVGGIPTPLKNITVHGKDYPIYDGKNMFETNNQIHLYARKRGAARGV